MILRSGIANWRKKDFFMIMTHSGRSHSSACHVKVVRS